MTVKDLKIALSQFDEDEELLVAGSDITGYDISSKANLAFFFRNDDNKLVLSGVETSGKDPENKVRLWNDRCLQFVGKDGHLYG